MNKKSKYLIILLNIMILVLLTNTVQAQIYEEVGNSNNTVIMPSWSNTKDNAILIGSDYYTFSGYGDIWKFDLTNNYITNYNKNSSIFGAYGIQSWSKINDTHIHILGVSPSSGSNWIKFFVYNSLTDSFSNYPDYPSSISGGEQRTHSLFVDYDNIYVGRFGLSRYNTSSNSYSLLTTGFTFARDIKYFDNKIFFIGLTPYSSSLNMATANYYDIATGLTHNITGNFSAFYYNFQQCKLDYGIYMCRQGTSSVLQNKWFLWNATTGDLISNKTYNHRFTANAGYEVFWYEQYKWVAVDYYGNLISYDTSDGPYNNLLTIDMTNVNKNNIQFDDVHLVGYNVSGSVYWYKTGVASVVNPNITIYAQPSDVFMDFNNEYSNVPEAYFTPVADNLVNFSLNFTFNETNYYLSVINRTSGVGVAELENDYFQAYVISTGAGFSYTLMSEAKNFQITDMRFTGIDKLDNVVVTNNFTFNVSGDNVFVGDYVKIKDFPSDVSMPANTVKNYYINDYYDNYDYVTLIGYCESVEDLTCIDKTQWVELGLGFGYFDVYPECKAPMLYALYNIIDTSTGSFEVQELTYTNVSDDVTSFTEAKVVCPDYMVELIPQINNRDIILRFTSFSTSYENVDSEFSSIGGLPFYLDVELSSVFYPEDVYRSAFDFHIISSEGLDTLGLGFLNTLFPDSDTMTTGGKLLRVIGTMLLTIVLIIIIVAQIESGQKAFTFIGAGILLLEFFFFVSIGYISVIYLLVIGIISSAIIYYLVNSSGVTTGGN